MLSADETAASPESDPVGSFFFFNDTATTEIYTLSLHDALPISLAKSFDVAASRRRCLKFRRRILDISQTVSALQDRKSTRLNSSHLVISYAVFCLKKKKPTKLGLVACCQRDLVLLACASLFCLD